MALPSVVFQLRADSAGAAYDASVNGLQVVPLKKPKAGAGSARATRTVRGAASTATREATALSVARNANIEKLQTFGIEARIRIDAPKSAAGRRTGAAAAKATRRVVVSSEKPGIRLSVDDKGKVFGEVKLASGWAGVDSGRARLQPGVPAEVSFQRGKDGSMALEIDRVEVGRKQRPGTIEATGDGGLTIAATATGRQVLRGEVSSLVVFDAPFGARQRRQLELAGKKLSTRVREKSGLRAVDVQLLPSFASPRLQQVKELMQAVGVTRLSDLGALKLTAPMTITPGKVVLGPRNPLQSVQVDWAAQAAKLVASAREDRGELLSTLLPNRNSAKLLSRLSQPSVPVTPTAARRTRASRERVVALPSRVKRDTSAPGLAQLLHKEGATLSLAGAGLDDRVRASEPARWIGTALDTIVVMPVRTIPTDSAVLMAPLIDLSNAVLQVDPAVTTLYVIADKLVCGNNATITWARTTGTTPPRADDPDLNGQSWHGVHTPQGSRHGLRGGDGGQGGTGAEGARGRDAPNLEIWVKDLEGMPNLDLNGADGAVGGRGQRGGRGGRGADGHVGRKTCVFVCWCSTDAGDGGDGGHGGNGGAGGRGGNGGDGGDVFISVLEGTLEATVDNRRFKIKNQGGRSGRGGDGGDPGDGGGGGRSGNGEECRNAEGGHPGSRGQPGARGTDGSRNGGDGSLTLSVFSLAEWEDLLRRPWLTEVNPKDAFPGDTLTLRGSLFLPDDRVLLGDRTLVPAHNADQSISVAVPVDMPGGLTSICFRRGDGTESNRYSVGIKPQLDALPTNFIPMPGAMVRLTGRAFVAGAAVLLNGDLQPATLVDARTLAFTMPGLGGGGSAGGQIALQVRNPDGFVSNVRTTTRPRILEIPFRTDRNGLSFKNPDRGSPSWSTFEQTFGTAEVWHELLDPVFGHPILTGAYYAFYHYFLKGKNHGGLATGFCTSVSALVADKFWKGETDTPALLEDDWRDWFTAVHGRLLSRESLITFHDQGRQGDARVEITARAIERTFLSGCDRNNAPLLFFIPSGALWDDGYVDKLDRSHCILPYRFVYPPGHPGPQLSADGSTTTTDLDGVELYCWDCNHPYDFANPANDISTSCRLVFHKTASGYRYEYRYGTGSAGAGTLKFSTEQGITLGLMTLGDYLLADHDLPFSGNWGLTRFVIDFLLSPADLQITDPDGRRTGNFNGKLVAEIADSHPCYLVPGAYLLPPDTPLTRRIVGNGNGTYAFNSIMPGGGSLVLEGLSTRPGEVDVLSVSADGTQIRFEPEQEKTFALTLSRQVGKQTRAVCISGVGGGPQAGVDITLSPELSLARVGNRGGARQLEVRAFAFNETGRKVVNKSFGSAAVGAMQDLVLAVEDWKTLKGEVAAIDIE